MHHSLAAGRQAGRKGRHFLAHSPNSHHLSTLFASVPRKRVFSFIGRYILRSGDALSDKHPVVGVAGGRGGGGGIVESGAFGIILGNSFTP